MDYEKEYKKLKADIEKAYLFAQTDSTKAVPEHILPELKESEEERIRKCLITIIKIQKEGSFGLECNHGASWNEMLSWLEKQGEQKEANLVKILKHYPKETELYSPLYGRLWLAEVDEKNEIITCYKHRLEEGCTRAVLEQEDTVSFYSNGTTGLSDFNTSKDCMLFLYDIAKQGEQKPADKVEPKFNVGDNIRRKTPSSCDKDMQVARIEKDYYVCNHIGKFSSEVIPFSKEPSYELIGQKPTWSKKDDEIVTGIINDIQERLEDYPTEQLADIYFKEIKWLKSIKERIGG